MSARGCRRISPVPLLAGVLALAVAAALAPRAHAVIKASTPPSSMYEASAAVAVGKVTRVSTDTGVIEVASTALRGTLPETLKFKLQAVPEVLKRVAVDAPAVLIVGRRTASNALHVGDTWVWPNPVAGSAGAYVVEKELGANLRQSFPGTTAALARLMKEIHGGNAKALINEVSPEMFKGGTKELGKIDAGLTRLVAVRAGESKEAYLLAGSAAGWKAWKVSAAGVAPAGDDPVSKTPGFPGPADLLAASALRLPAAGAAATVRTGGPSDLVTISKAGKMTVHARGGGATDAVGRALWSGDASAPVAAAAGAGGFEPGPLFVALVRPDDILILPIEDGTSKSAPSDFVRLTGEHLATYFHDDKAPLAAATAAPLDCNGDGLTDLLVSTPARQLLLINRGFGTFFVNADIGKALAGEGGKSPLADKTPWTALDVDGDGLDDLVYLRADGTLVAVMNPKLAEKK